LVPRSRARISSFALPTAVFLASLFVFNANLRRIGTWDSKAASLLPFNFWEGRGFAMDRFSRFFPSPFDSLLVRSPSGHLVSLYPVVAPILAAPLYTPWVLARAAGRNVDEGDAVEPLEKFAASVLAALSVAALFTYLDRVTSRRSALILAGAYAFGTSTWVVSSQALWQHGTAELLLAVSLLLLGRETLGPALLVVLGLVAGLLTANRPVDVFFSLAITFIVLRRFRHRALPFGLGAAVVASPWLLYNETQFRSILGGYGQIRLSDGRPIWMATNGLEGFAGLLASNRGLLWYSPFLLLFLRAPARGARRLPGGGMLLAAAALVLYVSARTTDWAGGYCYGPRLATDTLPVLVAALAVPLEDLRSRPGKILFALAILASVAIQAIGAFCFPGGDSGNEQRGLWNVQNFSPRLALRAGLQTPDFAALLWPEACVRERLPDDGIAAQYQWASDPPRTWQARESARVRIRVANASSSRWSSLGNWRDGGAVRLAGSWRGVPEGAPYSTPLGDWWLGMSLLAGESLERTVAVTAPNVSGAFQLCLELVQIGHGAFSDRGTPPLCRDVTISEGTRRPSSPLAVEWAGGFGPDRIVTGEEAVYRVRARNLSDRSWGPSVFVSYHWTRYDGPGGLFDGRRTPLPPNRAGEHPVWVDARVRANVPPGLYALHIDLVEEGRAWASDAGSPAMMLLVRIVESAGAEEAGGSGALPVYWK
jgi:hypothetical protein